FMERGDFTLIGATTENPGYELTSALLSRSKVLIFEPLNREDLLKLIHRAENETGVQTPKFLSPDALDLLIENAAGDARRLLTTLESLARLYRNEPEDKRWPITVGGMEELNLLGPVRYDKDRDEHYNVIS